MLGLGNSIITPADSKPTFANKYSVDFDGSNDYLEVEDHGTLDFNAGFSVNFWVYPDASTANDRMIAKGTTGTGEWMISFGSGAAIRVYTKDGNDNALDFTSTNTLSTGAWAMVTVVVNRTASKIQVYKNGGNLNESSDASWDSGWANSQALRIGLNSAGSNEFEGQISEVAIWNGELSSAEVTKLYGSGAPSFNLRYNRGDYTSASNLVGYWRMGDGVGDKHPTILDKSNNTNNATMTNMATDDITLSAP
tara:strand:+ start:439 stop:1191 length:753 start_codon:yes stop_codon:yes gene_type:complete